MMWWRAAAMGVLALAGLVACHRGSDEQRIREAIAGVQRAVEARAPRDALEFISADFIGNDGEADRQGLGNLLRVQALRNARQNVLLGPVDVQVTGDRATADLTATLAGASTDSAVPERASIWSIHSSWRREGGSWRCYNARWEQKL